MPGGKKRNKARVLSVHEVSSLEGFLSNERNLSVDRFAAGCSLLLCFLEAGGQICAVFMGTLPTFWKWKEKLRVTLNTRPEAIKPQDLFRNKVCPCL